MKMIANTNAPKRAIPPMVAPAMIPAFLEPSPPDLGTAVGDSPMRPFDAVLPGGVDVGVVGSTILDGSGVENTMEDLVGVGVGVAIGFPVALTVPGFVAYKVSPVYDGSSHQYLVRRLGAPYDGYSTS